VTFGDGDFEGAFGLAGGHGAGLNFIRLHTPTAAPSCRGTRT
jgi:N-methylhydantoinase B